MRFEGYRRRAARLEDGRWTIGYGHTLTAREGAEVSHEDAAALLVYDVRPIAAAVNELIYTPLTQNQFDALVAFAFNVGIDNFRRSSVLRRVNEGAMIQAACALEMWRKADFEGERIVVDALVRRRAAEKTLFLTPSDGWIPAPSPIVRPKVDYDVGLSTGATELETLMTGDVAQAQRAQAPEAGSASLAAADALSLRLNQILPEPAEIVPFEPPPPPKEVIAPVEAPIEPPEPVPAPEPEPAYLAAPVLFSALFAGSTATPETAPEPAPHPQTFEPLAVEPVAEVDTAPHPLESEPARDPRFDIPEGGPVDLSRRVVWREAPMETDASRLLGNRLGGLTPLLLLFLFLGGLAVFGGGIIWGLNTKGSGLISWVLGLVGIICVVSAVYVYLERLGGHED